MERSRPAATADSAGSGHGGSRWRLDHRRGMSEGEVVFERACLRDEREDEREKREGGFGRVGLVQYMQCKCAIRPCVCSAS
jgi:hypothetical protein